VKGSLAFTALMLAGILSPFLLSAIVKGFFLFDIVEWVLGTVVIGVLAMGSALYFRTRLDSVNDLYGALGLAIVVQLWLYLLARLYVGGQFLNATIAGVDPGSLGSDAWNPSVDSGA
jgi:uncharacterized BrkB/YihY/UPF0761 family membrane protein